MRRPARAVPTTALLVLLLLGPSVPAGAQEREAPAVAERVSAAGAVLWDPLDGRALWQRAGDAPRRMASTTKIMTALLALEAGTIDDVVDVSPAADAADAEPGAATLQLRTGQRIPMRSLLTGLMMRSGNDAAAAVAEHVAGSQAAFVDLMNERADELGLEDTNFLDTSGLSDSAEHHASPIDLARLAHHAMSDATFADLVDDFRADVPGLGTLTSRNLLLDTYRGATGVKTGYTSLAGLCLVASATRDGRTLYTAVLGSEDNFADTEVLLDHGFDAFAVVDADDAAIGVYRTAAGSVDLRIVDASAHTVPVDATVRVRSVLTTVAPPRIARGTRLGRAELVVDGEVVETADIEAATPLADDEATDDATPPALSDGAAGDAPAAVAAGAAVEDALRAFARSRPRRTPVPLAG